MHLVLADQLLGLEDAHRRLGLVVLQDEFDRCPGEVVLDLVCIHPPTVDHILAGLGKRARDWRDEADAYLFGGAWHPHEADGDGDARGHHCGRFGYHHFAPPLSMRT